MCSSFISPRFFAPLLRCKAEGTFNIKAMHPMFYKWTKCLDCVLEDKQQAGYVSYYHALLFYVGVQGLFVWVACAAIAKM